MTVGEFFRSDFHHRLDRRMRRIDAWLRQHGIPISIGTPGWWWLVINSPGSRVGRFKKRYKGVYNPRRWGGHILGLEIGFRG